MASRGRGRRGRPRGTGQAPPAFDQPPVFSQQAFAEAVGITAAADRPKTRCVKYVPKCASARVAPSNIVYLKYGYRSTGKGELTTEVLLFRQYLNK